MKGIAGTEVFILFSYLKGRLLNIMDWHSVCNNGPFVKKNSYKIAQSILCLWTANSFVHRFEFQTIFLSRFEIRPLTILKSRSG